ncbi:type II toxin-antitoxin system RelE/ParE family toxin [Achromobacter ruhlandii]|uniref:type II toxin-antitoxin system RelE/ParE family toxin n=1 Tax=Achromobacter ruhlandii TaxID=72557 RepID=UPI00298DE169|nr:type II toxin-antitoxin system RelE/ParE family toxin [Achromobacter ruhlandii]
MARLARTRHSDSRCRAVLPGDGPACLFARARTQTDKRRVIVDGPVFGAQDGSLQTRCRLGSRAVNIITGYKLHSLKGELANQWSVWVNGNWRVTFRFTEAGVELVDYRDYH